MGQRKVSVITNDANGKVFRTTVLENSLVGTEFNTELIQGDTDENF